MTRRTAPSSSDGSPIIPLARKWSPAFVREPPTAKNLSLATWWPDQEVMLRCKQPRPGTSDSQHLLERRGPADNAWSRSRQLASMSEEKCRYP